MNQSILLKIFLFAGTLCGLPLTMQSATLSTTVNCDNSNVGDPNAVLTSSFSPALSQCSIKDGSGVLASATAQASLGSVSVQQLSPSAPASASATSSATVLLTFTGATGTGYFRPCAEGGGTISLSGAFGAWSTSGNATPLGNPLSSCYEDSANAGPIFAFTYNQTIEATLSASASVSPSVSFAGCCAQAALTGFLIFDPSEALNASPQVSYTIVDIATPEPATFALSLLAVVTVSAASMSRRFRLLGSRQLQNGAEGQI